MGIVEDILAQADAEEKQYSSIRQSFASGLMPQVGNTAPMTQWQPETYQRMTPISGPLFTPAKFTDLPAEERSMLELDSLIKQNAQRNLLRAEQTRLSNRPILAGALNASDALVLGFGTEAAAALEAPFSEKTFGQLRQDYGRAREELFKSNPIASTIGGIGGVGAQLLSGGGLVEGAAAAGRTVPTLAERLFFGTTAPQLIKAGKEAGTVASTAKELGALQTLKEAVKSGALQSGLQGIGATEAMPGESAQQELQNRLTGGAIGAGLGAALPVAGTAAAGLYKGIKAAPGYLSKTWNKWFTPISQNEADIAAGTIAKDAGVRPEVLAEKIAETQAETANPLAKHLTTTELLQSPELAQLDAAARSQPGRGTQTFWDKERQQLEQVNKIMRDSTGDIDLNNPENAIRIQEGAQQFIKDRSASLQKQADEMYQDLPSDVTYKRKDLLDKIKGIYKKFYSDAKGNVSPDIRYGLQYLEQKLAPTEGTFGRRGFEPTEIVKKKGKVVKVIANEPPPEITGKELVALRSRFLASARELESSDPNQARLANEAGQAIHDFILTDTKNFGPKYNEANNFYSNLIDTYHSGRLTNITNPAIVSPENLTSKVTENLDAWRKFQKMTGYSPKQVTDQVKLAFDEFKNTGADAKTIQEAVQKKLDWLNSKGTILFMDSPLNKDLAETFAKAKQSLTFARDFLKTKKSATDLVAPGFNADDLRMMGADELAQIALSANIKAGSPASKALKAAFNQFTRDKTRQILAATGGAALAGGAAYASGQNAPYSIAAGAAGAALLAAGGWKHNVAAQRTAQTLQEALLAGLRDPNKMLNQIKMADMAGARTAKVVSNTADIFAKGTGQKLTQGLTKSAAAVKPQVEQMNKPVPSDDKQLLDEIISSYKKPVATPTPTAEPKKSAKFSLISSAEAETPKKKVVKYKIPTGSNYAPPHLVKAVIQVESGKRPQAVSPKGAKGLMQIMDATAKSLNIDPRDPQQNIEGGSRYLQQLIKRFGDTKIALAAYNWGPTNIGKIVKRFNAVNRKPTWAMIKKMSIVPTETKNYVDRVMNLL